MTKKESDGGGGGGGARKGSIGTIFRGLFRAKKIDKKEEKVAVKRQESESAAAVVSVNFGIETTEVLPRIQRVKPPQNRRRPTRPCQVCNGMHYYRLSVVKDQVDVHNILTCKSMANLREATTENAATEVNGEVVGEASGENSNRTKRPILLPPTTTMPMLAPLKKSPSPPPTSDHSPAPSPPPASERSPPPPRPPPPGSSKPTSSEAENR